MSFPCMARVSIQISRSITANHIPIYHHITRCITSYKPQQVITTPYSSHTRLLSPILPHSTSVCNTRYPIHRAVDRSSYHHQYKQIRRNHTDELPPPKTREQIERELELEYYGASQKLGAGATTTGSSSPKSSPFTPSGHLKALEEAFRLSLSTKFLIGTVIFIGVGYALNRVTHKYRHEIRFWSRKLRGRDHIPRRHHNFVPLTPITEDKICDHDQLVYRISMFQRNLVALISRSTAMSKSCKEMGKAIEKWKHDTYLPIVEYSSPEAVDDATLDKLDTTLDDILKTYLTYNQSTRIVSRELEILNKINVEEYKDLPLKVDAKFEDLPDHVKAAIRTICEGVTKNNQRILNLHFRLDLFDGKSIDSFREWDRIQKRVVKIEEDEKIAAQKRHSPDEQELKKKKKMDYREYLAGHFQSILDSGDNSEMNHRRLKSPKLLPDKKKKKRKRKSRSI